MNRARIIRRVVRFRGTRVGRQTGYRAAFITDISMAKATKPHARGAQSEAVLMLSGSKLFLDGTDRALKDATQSKS